MIKDIGRFLIEVKSELGKVVWPRTEEWVESTVVVLFLVAAFALYTGAVDLGFSYLMQYIFTHYR
jgi:preprotein translocase SecE subunit